MIDWFDICVTRSTVTIHDIDLTRPVEPSVFRDRFFEPETNRPHQHSTEDGYREARIHSWDWFGLTLIEDAATGLVSSVMIVLNPSKAFYSTRNMFAGRFQLGDMSLLHRDPETRLGETGLDFKRIRAGLRLAVVTPSAPSAVPVSVIVESKFRRGLPPGQVRKREIVSVSFCPHSTESCMTHPTSDGRHLTLALQR